MDDHTLVSLVDSLRSKYIVLPPKGTYMYRGIVISLVAAGPMISSMFVCDYLNMNMNRMAVNINYCCTCANK